MLATCPKVRRQLGFGTRRLLGKSPVDEGRRLTALKKIREDKTLCQRMISSLLVLVRLG